MSSNLSHKEEYKIKEIKTQLQSIETNNEKELKPDSEQNLDKKESEENILKGKKEINPNDYGFTLDPSDLEDLMGYYKERGNDYKDILYFEKQNGIQNLLNSLQTNVSTGIKTTQGREEFYGSNKIFTEPVQHFCMFVWEALEDLMVRILIICAIVSIVLGCTLSDDPSKDWIDGVSIIIAVLVVVLVGSITNYQKETKFHELNEVQNEGTKYKVIRNKEPQDLTSDDILVGDLIIVNYGDIIPADLLLVEGNGIKMDESALTGESDNMLKEPYEHCLEIKKNLKKDKNSEAIVPSPLILSGTNCIEGNGKAIVIAVGDHSQKGIIRRTVDNAQENNQTPLQEKLDKIATLIGYFGMGAGIVTLIALFIRFGIDFPKQMKDYNKDSKIETIMTYFLFNFPDKKNSENIIGNVNNNLTNPKTLIAKKILDIIILCISIIVVAIPEGLPLAVTLSLAFSIKKMMDHNNLVRKMHACETMGGANYICTDKTGTLTKNEMNVYKILAGNEIKELKQNIEVNDVGIVNGKKENKKIREDYKNLYKNDNFWNILKIAIALNVECQIKKFEKEDENGDMESCETKNKTDKAFIDFLYRFKSPISKEKEKYLSNNNNFKQFPFDSKRKRMTTFIHNKEFPTGYRLFTKGGGENSHKYCKSYLDPETGNIKKIDDIINTQIKDSIKEFNKNKLRSLYIAYKDISKGEFENCEKVNENGKLIDQYDLNFIAVFGIKDSLRDGVKEAVRKCHEASVNVIMVTGDNIVTATAIGKDCGILDDSVNLKNLKPSDIEEDPELINDKSQKDSYIKNILKNEPKALTGNTFYSIIEGLICEECKKDTNLCECPKTEAEAKQLAKKNNGEIKKIKKDKIKNIENFLKITKNLKIMARSQPIHKYALVLGLKSSKNVVAVTGDGTNDAPALSKSDVGFAMFAGTDIAKEASDIVIIDNNFSSIITAIIYGRNIYDNIRKFLQFQLSVNFCACLIVFICACIGNETPLTPIQMLWVNLIMDSLGSLALATEPPYDELLQRKPTKRNESIISGRMWKHISLQSLIQIVILLILYLIAPKFIEEDNLVRLAENKIIKYCYGKIPGAGTNEKKIISGTESDWSSDIKLRHNIDKDYCGSYSSRQSLSVAFKEYSNVNCGTVHMTVIFNVFVIYTLFNQINCRVLDDSFNIFKRIHRSYLFIIITLCEMGLQVLMIFVGNAVFHVSFNGLTGKQWGICIGFSAITFIVSIIAKLIPLEKIIDKFLVNKEEEEDNEDEVEDRNEDRKDNEDIESINRLKIRQKQKFDKKMNININSSNRDLKINQNNNNFNFKKKRDNIDRLQISQESQ